MYACGERNQETKRIIHIDDLNFNFLPARVCIINFRNVQKI